MKALCAAVAAAVTPIPAMGAAEPFRPSCTTERFHHTFGPADKLAQEIFVKHPQIKRVWVTKIPGAPFTFEVKIFWTLQGVGE
jgi:hypothetical protein